MKINVEVTATEAGEALNFIRQWAEDAAGLTYYPAFPSKCEWNESNNNGDVSLRAWMWVEARDESD